MLKPIASLLVAVCTFAICAAPLAAAQGANQTPPAADPANWPNFRGPDHNGIAKDAKILTAFPADGPKALWKAKVGEGYSGVAVANKKAYTMGNSGDKDTIFCFDAEKGGDPVWSKTYDCKTAGGGYGGPRATPCVDGKLVYCLSNSGILTACDADKGDIKFTKNLAQEVGAKTPQWGFASSCIVDGNNLLINLNTAGVAVNKTDGTVVWKSDPGAPGYATPVLFTQNNRKCVAIFSAKELVAVDAANGAKLWSYPWVTQYDVNAADPIISGNEVFISSNYGKGGSVLDLASGQPKKVWENTAMKNHANSCILINGFLFGNSEGVLTCIDWKTGETKWTGEKKMDKGGLTAAGDKLIVLTAGGNLLIVDAKPDSYNVVAKAQVIGGTCWTSPTLSAGHLFCRSHEGDLACVDLKP